MGQTSLESMRNRLEEIQYITSNGLFFRTLFTQTAILFVIPLLDFFWYHTRYVHFFFKGKELYFIVFLGDGAMRRTLLTFTTSLRFKTSFCSLSGYRYLFFFFQFFVVRCCLSKVFRLELFVVLGSSVIILINEAEL